MTGFRAARIVVWLLVSTTSAARVSADEASPHEQAIMAFEKARALIQNGDCTKAIPKLRESLSHEGSVGAHLSLAECYAPRDPLIAWRELKEAEFLTYTRGDDRTKIARSRAAELEPKLALIRIVVPAALLQSPGLLIKVDDVMTDRFYYEGGVIAVTPGHHVVGATMPGKVFTGSADATVGSIAEVPVVMSDAPTLRPEVAAAPPKPLVVRSLGWRTAGLVTGSVGLAGVVLGALSGVVSLAYAGDAKSGCGPHLTSCPTSNESSANKANVTAALSDVGLFGGGVLLVAGAVLYWTAPNVALGDSPTRTPGAASMHLAPALGPGSASLVLAGRF